MRFSIEWKVGLGLTILFSLIDPNRVAWRIGVLAVACLLFLDAARGSDWIKGHTESLSLTKGVVSQEASSVVRSVSVLSLIVIMVVAFGFITWSIRRAIEPSPTPVQTVSVAPNDGAHLPTANRILLPNTSILAPATSKPTRPKAKQKQNTALKSTTQPPQRQEPKPKAVQPVSTEAARLQFSFYTLNPNVIPIKEVSIPARNDVVTVEFVVQNVTTNVEARDGELWIRICEICRYAAEMSGWTQLPGASDSDRHSTFQRLFGGVALPKITTKIAIPSNVSRFEITSFYACDTCVSGLQKDTFFVNVARN
jgi:hypothetical protein